MRVVRRQNPRSRTAAAVVSGLLVVVAAACLLLARQRFSGAERAAWWARPGSVATAGAAVPSARAPGTCWNWQSVDRLDDRCMGELPVPSFQCCSGAGYKCRPCSERLLQALSCVSPRHMLLQLPPGCGGAPLLPGPLPPLMTQPIRGGRQRGQGGCMLSSEAVRSGRWVATSSTRWPGMPGLPGALFEPAGVACGGRCPLAGPAMLRCLQAAGYDRLLASGDSTVRQLFTRLIRCAVWCVYPALFGSL